jgi:hypothetical protein
VTVKAEEVLTTVRNVSVPYVEAEESQDGNLHAFEVVNVEWVPDKPGKADFKRAAELKRERRLARIEGREPNEDHIQIPPIHVTFP